MDRIFFHRDSSVMLATLPHLSFLSSLRLRLRLAFLPSLPSCSLSLSAPVLDNQTFNDRKCLHYEHTYLAYLMCPNVRTLDRRCFLSIYQFSFPNYKYDSSLIEHEHEHELHTTYCLITQEGFSYTVFCIPVAVRYQEIGVRGGGSVRSVSKSVTGRMLLRSGRVM